MYLPNKPPETPKVGTRNPRSYREPDRVPPSRTCAIVVQEAVHKAVQG